MRHLFWQKQMKRAADLRQGEIHGSCWGTEERNRVKLPLRSHAKTKGPIGAIRPLLVNFYLIEAVPDCIPMDTQEHHLFVVWLPEGPAPASGTRRI